MPSCRAPGVPLDLGRCLALGVRLGRVGNGADPDSTFLKHIGDSHAQLASLFKNFCILAEAMNKRSGFVVF